MRSDLTTPAPAIVPQLLTTKQAAQLCGCGERTLWRWSRCGIAPRPIKIGDGRQGAVRFRLSDIERWIGMGCPRVDAAIEAARKD